MNSIELCLVKKVWILRIAKEDGVISEERFGNGDIIMDGKLATIHAKSIAKTMLPCYYVKRDSNGRVIEEETLE